MTSLLTDVDRLLRGGFTRDEDLQSGRLRLPAGRLILACLGLGALYGVMMGLYAGAQHDNWAQAFASAVKVPLLFLLTLAVTFPSLYVFSALARSRLDLSSTLRLLLVAIAVDLAVLASFGPVTAFFTFSTSSYPFMKVLNVLFFGIAGLIGLGFLWRTLEPILGARPPAPTPAEEPKEGQTSSWRPTPRPDPAGRVFRTWLVIYGVVGAQMGWLLRPFVGSPGEDFAWFRERESNFLHDLTRTLVELFS